MTEDNLQPIPIEEPYTKRMLEDFCETVIWRDFKKTMLDRIEILRTMLENFTGESESEEKIRGRIAELRYILALPDNILRTMNMDSEDISNSQEAEDNGGN